MVEGRTHRIGLATRASMTSRCSPNRSMAGFGVSIPMSLCSAGSAKLEVVFKTWQFFNETVRLHTILCGLVVPMFADNARRTRPPEPDKKSFSGPCPPNRKKGERSLQLCGTNPECWGRDGNYSEGRRLFGQLDAAPEHITKVSTMPRRWALPAIALQCSVQV